MRKLEFTGYYDKHHSPVNLGNIVLIEFYGPRYDIEYKFRVCKDARGYVLKEIPIWPEWPGRLRTLKIEEVKDGRRITR